MEGLLPAKVYTESRSFMITVAGGKGPAVPRNLSPNVSAAQPSAAAGAAAAGKPKEKVQPFGPFPKGRKGLVEKSSLIRHSPSKARQEELQRMQSAERSSTNSENQAFLKDVSTSSHLLCHIALYVCIVLSYHKCRTAAHQLREQSIPEGREYPHHI